MLGTGAHEPQRLVIGDALDFKELQRQEALARAQVRKMETEGALPKMTGCAIKADTEGDMTVLRVLIRRLPLDGLHPLSKRLLVSMAVARVRANLERKAGISLACTCTAHPDVVPSVEFEAATRLVQMYPGFRGISLKLQPLNQEYQEDMTGNPHYVQSFAKLAQIVEEKVQELLAGTGEPTNRTA